MCLPELKLKDSVKINGDHFCPEMIAITHALRITAPELSDNIVWITSANDSKHKSGSKHYINKAFDVRTRNVVGGIEMIKKWAGELTKELGPNYDVVVESDHLHLEHDVHVIPTSEDYAWMAGFIDGDGSFSLRVYNYTTRQMVQPVVQVSQLHPEPISQFKYFVDGGTTTIEERPGKGPVYRICIHGRDRLIKLTNGIFPYLRNKKHVAALFIEALELQKSKGDNRKYSAEDWAKFLNLKSKIEQLNRET